MPKPTNAALYDTQSNRCVHSMATLNNSCLFFAKVKESVVCVFHIQSSFLVIPKLFDSSVLDQHVFRSRKYDSVKSQRVHDNHHNSNLMKMLIFIPFYSIFDFVSTSCQYYYHLYGGGYGGIVQRYDGESFFTSLNLFRFNRFAWCDALLIATSHATLWNWKSFICKKTMIWDEWYTRCCCPYTSY